MMSQVNYVVKTIMNVLEENEVEYELGGEISVKEVINDVMLNEIRVRVLNGFNNNEVMMSDKGREKNNTPKLMKSYVNGMVNNWIRKYKPFNNGVKYVGKNVGSRKGSGDEQVREMRKLLKTITDPKIRVKIEEEIEKRILELSPKEEVNVEKLPEHLRYLV